MGASTITLQDVIDYGRTFPDLTPVLKAGGYVDQPARNIANLVMATMLGGGFVKGERVGPFPWKWNRQTYQFVTNSWQQDYAIVPPAGLSGISWIQDGIVTDINNTALPKPQFGLEVVRDLSVTSAQYGRPGQICWRLNRDLNYGVWGGGTALVVGGSGNPGVGVVYTNPVGAATSPANAITQIIDTNGNYLVLTTYGACGGSAPAAAVNAAPGTTVADGSCVWTVVDPYGYGFRLSPRPPQTGVVWQVSALAQLRPVLFTTTSQTIAPIPDDFGQYFKDGFIVHSYRHSPELKLRGRFQDELALWMSSLQEALGREDREKEGYGFYPDRGAMDNQGMGGPIGPAWPFGPLGF